ncbi:MAG TPA: dTDP-glucose 4,6-dehydratase [Elusimicrobiota bacterium]|nr:dTDP-glucose 4,6-dehydratase [Elusimicrobiota bacterium]
MRILVTGGAGFIGSHFVNYWLKRHAGDSVINLDKLTYAGNLSNLREAMKSARHRFIKGDITHLPTVKRTMKGVDTVVHFAAETHVDRSLLNADAFIRTNIQGTFTLTQEARVAGVKRFVHISTDEVYGSIEKGKTPETAPLEPSSPYSSSKAASDLMALSQWITHRFPVLITRCTNNYGPYQYPEKFLPLFITNAIDNVPLPLYGKGINIRNWLHVTDHCRAIESVVKRGKPGQIYNIAGDREWTNIAVAKLILTLMGKPGSLIRHVTDRPGHDIRYAPESGKIRRELGWRPSVTFEQGLKETISWYETHQDWWRKIKSDKTAYQSYYRKQYTHRINGGKYS